MTRSHFRPQRIRMGMGLLLALGMLPLAALAQPALPPGITYDIRHTTHSPDIDGVLSGGEWADAAHYVLDNETDPGQNTPAPYRTDVYIMEDGKNFLVAFRAEDPRPELLRALYRDRDQAFPDDRVGVVIDTFNDGRRAYEFWSNAYGSQVDQVNDDVAKSNDMSWNAIWDSAGQITETGYTVEMKIPLNQLRFQSGLPLQTWGLNFVRVHQRDVWQRMTDMRQDYSKSCYLCQIPKGQGFPDIKSETNLRLIPTLTMQKTERRPNPAVDPWQRDSLEGDAGIDLRWAIQENVILNATLNPDFSQVEADQAQLDVNRTFALYFPEKREFFLDGADYFNIAGVNIGNSTTLRPLYTRNISDPDFGAKLTGKEGDHTFALLAARDTRTGFSIPGIFGSSVATLTDTPSDDLALRYRYDADKNLTVGVLGTARQADNYRNTMTAIDGNWQVANSDRVAAVLMHSSSEYPGSVQRDFSQKPELSDDAWKLAYNHRGSFGFWNLTETNLGDDFRADLGFMNRVGIREHFAQTGFNWRRGTDHFFNSVNSQINIGRTEDQSGNKLQQVMRGSFWVNGPMQSYINLFAYSGDTFYNGRLFNTHGTSVYGELNPFNGFFFGSEFTREHSIDYANTQSGDITTISPWFEVRVGSHLQANLRYYHQTMDVTGGRLYTSDLADFRVTWQFSNKSFVRLVLINSDNQNTPALYSYAIDKRSRNLGTQFLYSYRFNAQTRFFVGYSDSASANSSTLPELSATYRSVFAKFSYAWQY